MYKHRVVLSNMSRLSNPPRPPGSQDLMQLITNLQKQLNNQQAQLTQQQQTIAFLQSNQTDLQKENLNLQNELQQSQQENSELRKELGLTRTPTTLKNRTSRMLQKQSPDTQDFFEHLLSDKVRKQLFSTEEYRDPTIVNDLSLIN